MAHKTVVTVNIHLDNELNAKAKHSNTTVWVELDSGVTIFVNSAEQVNAIVHAFNDAGNLLMSSQCDWLHSQAIVSVTCHTNQKGESWIEQNWQKHEFWQ